MAGFEPVIRLASGSSLWTARARLTASVVAVPPASLVRVACALPWFPNPITLSLIFSNPSINPDSPSASRLFLRSFFSLHALESRIQISNALLLGGRFFVWHVGNNEVA